MYSYESFSVFFSTFTLIALAEIGDKSQLVCMTLAIRHRHRPVILGAATSFIVLNTLAVLFGAGVAAWVPERVTTGLVAMLFAAFGIHALYSRHEDITVNVDKRPAHGIFIATFLLIFVAEFGDKTQIAVAGLASGFAPLPVWLGATVALILVSALGVWLGRTVLQQIPLKWLHRLSGAVFILFALLAAWKTLA